jgi:succinate-acetate transporter protein
MFAGVAFSSYGAFWLGLGIYGTLAQAGPPFSCM